VSFIRLFFIIQVFKIIFFKNLFILCRELSFAYPEQILFKSLLSGLPFQSQSSLQQQLPQNILIRLRQSKGNGESLNTVLIDLDKISESKPEILEYFVVNNNL
jgi:hypothetical protein